MKLPSICVSLSKCLEDKRCSDGSAGPVEMLGVTIEHLAVFDHAAGFVLAEHLRQINHMNVPVFSGFFFNKLLQHCMTFGCAVVFFGHGAKLVKACFILA